jgi:RimJ/RimL family protein N-acetyltransferase
VDVTSLAFRTDLALLQLGGSTVEDRGDHLVVRTPHNPAYWWGNFLLLDRVPQPGEHESWVARFAAALPDARHLAFGVDGTVGQAADLAGFTALGLEVEATTVMTATSVHRPPRPNDEADYRRLASDDDWAQSLRLRLVASAGDDPGSETFEARRVATDRATTEAGHGAWFGAFVDGRLAAQMGLAPASPGLARFRLVETDPAYRGRGLAGTLVHHVSEYGFGELGASTLVMVADPDYLAVRIYRSVGFDGTETQLQAQRAQAERPRSRARR